MTYDLTSVLTTIAACSASIAAIIGGFIASKLIAINTERSERKKQIEDVETEINYYREELELLQCKIEMYRALSMINEGFEDIQKGISYNAKITEKYKDIESKDMEKYWIKARRIYDQIIKESQPSNSFVVTNKTEQEDEFSLKVNQLIASLLHPEKTPTFEPLPNESIIHETASLDESRIDMLENKRKSLLNRYTVLNKPKGLTSGLILFISFSILNIILPLCISPWQTTNYPCYVKVKFLFIGVFLVGLIAIFIYLNFLLTKSKK